MINGIEASSALREYYDRRPVFEVVESKDGTTIYYYHIDKSGGRRLLGRLVKTKSWCGRVYEIVDGAERYACDMTLECARSMFKDRNEQIVHEEGPIR